MKWFKIDLAWAEQVVYRSEECSDCLKRGYCEHCGCPTPELFYDRKNSCSGGKWGPMFDAKQWNEYKKLINRQ